MTHPNTVERLHDVIDRLDAGGTYKEERETLIDISYSLSRPLLFNSEPIAETMPPRLWLHDLIRRLPRDEEDLRTGLISLYYRLVHDCHNKAEALGRVIDQLEDGSAAGEEMRNQLIDLHYDEALGEGTLEGEIEFCYPLM